MRIEYQLGVTLVSSFVVVAACLLVKLALLPPNDTKMAEQASQQNNTSDGVNSNTTSQRYSMTAQEYERVYRDSLSDPDKFWGEVAVQLLTWIKPFSRVYESGPGDNPFDGFKWFSDGTLNACYNAVDRHAATNPNKTAIIWEPDDPGKDKVRTVTYGELLANVQQVASYLKSIRVKKGDRVTVYLPVLPETLTVILACARIGAVHNVVFAGFGWEALRGRIQDSQSRVIFTANAGRRGGRVIDLKGIVDKALTGCPQVEHVVVFRRLVDQITVMQPGRDVWWDESVDRASYNCPVEEMGAEDPLFILYTSGSTGSPKALLHTHGGYLVFATYTFKTVFDYSPDEVFFCTADFGWITGHSYLAYGPLIANGTIVAYEGLPTYPSPSRLWRVINEHNVKHFYTAPTLLRIFKRLGDGHLLDCPQLRTLGSVGEPIDPPTWQWYYDAIGRGRCSIADTYWQTETGGHVISTIPGTFPLAPGYAGRPLPGIDLDILPVKPSGGTGEGGALVIKRPWPGMARTIYRDHRKYLQTYFQEYPGYYFTGDGAVRDHSGNYRIQGRIDDVVNVSGHRFGTAEIEAVLTRHPVCSEAAVLGKPDPVTGQSMTAFCLLKTDHPDSQNVEKIQKELRDLVRGAIGPAASPKYIFFPSDLPKTRSGKIMRRVLRRVLAGEEDMGDLSTLTNPGLIEELRQLMPQS